MWQMAWRALRYLTIQGALWGAIILSTLAVLGVALLIIIAILSPGFSGDRTAVLMGMLAWIAASGVVGGIYGALLGSVIAVHHALFWREDRPPERYRARLHTISLLVSLMAVLPLARVLNLLGLMVLATIVIGFGLFLMQRYIAHEPLLHKQKRKRDQSSEAQSSEAQSKRDQSSEAQSSANQLQSVAPNDEDALNGQGARQ